MLVGVCCPYLPAVGTCILGMLWLYISVPLPPIRHTIRESALASLLAILQPRVPLPGGSPRSFLPCPRRSSVQRQ